MTAAAGRDFYLPCCAGVEAARTVGEQFAVLAAAGVVVGEGLGRWQAGLADYRAVGVVARRRHTCT
jgi:hypothetical protein